MLAFGRVFFVECDLAIWNPEDSNSPPRQDPLPSDASRDPLRAREWDWDHLKAPPGFTERHTLRPFSRLSIKEGPPYMPPPFMRPLQLRVASPPVFLRRFCFQTRCNKTPLSPEFSFRTTYRMRRRDSGRTVTV